MANEMVRVVLLPAGADEAGDEQIWLDLIRDDQTRESTGPFPAFGRIGDFRKPETLVPFTLMMDGRLDTGVHAGDDKRQDFLAIRKAVIEPGTVVALTWGSGSAQDYRIDKITPLIS